MGVLATVSPTMPYPCPTWAHGDSITSGGAGIVAWPTYLHPPFVRSFAFPGFVAEQVAVTLPDHLENEGWPRPTLMILLVGINDLFLGVTQEETFGFLDDIVGMLDDAGIDYRFVTLLPLPENHNGWWSLDDERLAHNARLATDYPGKVIDVEDDMGNGASPNRLPTAWCWGDEVHVNNTGQAALAAVLKPHVVG